MISIIIPTYNGIETLRQSLPTWLNQTLSAEEFEVIVVDNQSTDETHEEVERMIAGYPNFQYLFEAQPGATAARHAGVKASRGDILAFADDDGLYNPECLQRIHEVYDGNAQCEAVTGKIEIQWDGQEPDWIAPYRFMLGELDYGDQIRYGYDLYLNGGLMSVKKATFERLHGFNPDLIGDHLIGDGDTGLVKKMFENHCLIGYTPFAVMKHMQKVSVHGTEAGLGRHFYNNGIAEAYALFRKNHFRKTAQVKSYQFKQRLMFLKKWVEYHTICYRERKAYFSLQQRKGALQFFRLLRQPDMAMMIKVENVY